MSFLGSGYSSAQYQSAVNAPLLESSVLTLDLNTHPHLTHVVSYSRAAHLHAFGGMTSFFLVIAFAPQGLGDHGFVSVCFSGICEASMF